MAQLGGLKADHTGTCVIYPGDLKTIEPTTIAEQFHYEMTPLTSADRATYRLSDHTTTLARAVVWFGSWPRKGRDLDNFIGCGNDSPMNGSHLCHQALCIVHVCYESSDINQDRKHCYKLALFLRQQSEIVPEFCDKHEPPCLMRSVAPCFFALCLCNLCHMCCHFSCDLNKKSTDLHTARGSNNIRDSLDTIQCFATGKRTSSSSSSTQAPTALL